MTTFERYVLRRLTAAFALTLVALAGVVWATQALRRLDLVTSKGQTIVQFIGMTFDNNVNRRILVQPLCLKLKL